MNKSLHVFLKLAKKKADKKKINPAYPIAIGGAAAVGGLAHTFRKPSGMSHVKMPKKEIREFIKKLKPGDVLTTGAYNAGTANPYQFLLNRNKVQYHSAVHLGKGVITEMIPDGMSIPRKRTDRHSIRDFASSEAYVAHRPKLTEKARKKFVHDVAVNQKKYTFDSKASTRAFLKNKVEKILPMKQIMKVLPKKTVDKVFGCKGKFCSNLASSHLPQKMFKVHKTVTMPIDYHNPKHFEYVGELIKKTRVPHLPAATPTLIKYVGKPALAVGAGVAIADMLGVI